MNSQLEHDRKLQKYLESPNKNNLVPMILERIPLIITELDEAIKYAKSQKN